MPYVPFFEYFPELGPKETRSITIISRQNEWNLPPGEYGFLELFCNEKGCDCRRVFLYVRTPTSPRPLAVIGYGWEDAEFYARWMHGGTPEDIAELKGPALAALSPQTNLSPALLKLAERTLLQDTDYIDRLKRHYGMFRDMIDAAPPSARKWRTHRPKRRRSRR